MNNNLKTPFYDPHKTYEENYSDGPFGDFADKNVYEDKGEPRHDIFGNKVFLPFGIPAGPLLNGKYIKAAFDKGFDVAVYKTVRTRQFGCNPFPNVLAVKANTDITLDDADAGLVADDNYEFPLSITNSFGVPSMAPDVWQPDMAEAVKYAESRKGKLVIGSFQGTTNPEGDSQKYIADFALGAKLVKETGVKVIEVNLSCPNEGSAHLLCFDLERTKQVVEAIKNEVGETPLVIKIAYFESPETLSTLVKTVGPMVQGIAAINTIPAKIYKDDAHTEQALPGNNRLVSGVCGYGIRWAGLDMVTRLRSLREELNLKFTIFGGGGVSGAGTYKALTEAGADVVMSATGAMWNPHLAQEIKETLAA